MWTFSFISVSNPTIKKGIFYTFVEYILLRLYLKRMIGDASIRHQILVVDDQPGIRLLLQDILTHEGYQVTTAKTGKEASDYLKPNRFDLLVLDYKLPIMNGEQVLQELESAGVRIPVIMITGEKETAQSAIKHVDFDVELLAKPFNVVDVCRVVQDVLAKNE